MLSVSFMFWFLRFGFKFAFGIQPICKVDTVVKNNVKLCFFHVRTSDNRKETKQEKKTKNDTSVCSDFLPFFHSFTLQEHILRKFGSTIKKL